jgi:trehalose/maltose transport system substrate-binding protein
MTSPEGQKYRALMLSQIPTNPSVRKDPEVLEKLPFLPVIEKVDWVDRPNAQSRERYNDVSAAFFQMVGRVLRGKDAGQAAEELDTQLQHILQ